MFQSSDLDLISVERWARAHLGATTHERRVMRIAGGLFDRTAEMHGLPRRYRKLLRAAALVHDVGRCVNKAEHPMIGARMILRSRDLRLPDAARRALAFLTLYHRDNVPPSGAEAVLRNTDDRPSLRRVLALLRTADALDGRSIESPRLSIRIKHNRVRISCHLEDATGKAARVYRRRRKHKLLESEFGCRVKVTLRERMTA